MASDIVHCLCDQTNHMIQLTVVERTASDIVHCLCDQTNHMIQLTVVERTASDTRTLKQGYQPSHTDTQIWHMERAS